MVKCYIICLLTWLSMCYWEWEYVALSFEYGYQHELWLKTCSCRSLRCMIPVVDGPAPALWWGLMLWQDHCRCPGHWCRGRGDGDQAREVQQQVPGGAQHPHTRQENQVPFKLPWYFILYLYDYCSYDRNDNFLPVNHVGLINYLTVGWLSKIMWKAMKV